MFIADKAQACRLKGRNKYWQLEDNDGGVSLLLSGRSLTALARFGKKNERSRCAHD